MKLSISPGQVYTFKLNSGEELISKVSAVTDDWLEIEHPVSVAPGPQGMGLVPSLFTADPESEVTVNISSVAMIAPVREDVGDSYLEATTGIKPVRNKILMG